MWFWKCLIVNFEDWTNGFAGKNKKFYDMRYDKGFGMDEIGFWVDFVGGFRDLEELDFGVDVWMNQLIVIPVNIRFILVFAAPIYPEKYGIYIFFREYSFENYV